MAIHKADASNDGRMWRHTGLRYKGLPAGGCSNRQFDGTAVAAHAGHTRAILDILPGTEPPKPAPELTAAVLLSLFLAAQAAAAPLPVAAAAACLLARLLRHPATGPAAEPLEFVPHAREYQIKALARHGMLAAMAGCAGAEHAAGQLVVSALHSNGQEDPRAEPVLPLAPALPAALDAALAGSGGGGWHPGLLQCCIAAGFLECVAKAGPEVTRPLLPDALKWAGDLVKHLDEALGDLLDCEYGLQTSGNDRAGSDDTSHIGSASGGGGIGGGSACSGSDGESGAGSASGSDANDANASNENQPAGAGSGGRGSDTFTAAARHRPPRRPPPGRPPQGKQLPLQVRRQNLMQHPLLPAHRVRLPGQQQQAALQVLARRRLAGWRKQRVHGQQIGRDAPPAALRQLLLLVNTQGWMSWRHHSHSHRVAAAAWALQLRQRQRSSPSYRGLAGSCVR